MVSMGGVAEYQVAAFDRMRTITPVPNGRSLPMSAFPLPPPTAEGPLLAWLLEALRPMNRTRVKELLRDGRVTVNGTPTTRHDHPLRPGDRVTIRRDRPAGRDLERVGIKVVYEDDSLFVVDKPPGLLTVATEAEKTDTAFARLSTHLAARGAGRPFVVHRIDRETSGLLLFARSVAVRDRLQSSWDGVTKIYLAVVEGSPGPAEGVVENHLVEGRNLRVRVGSGPGAKRAVTRYRVVTSRGRYSLVEVRLETGRKHQIRVHLAGLGCPVVGDQVYGARTDPAGRLGLHAWKLALDHPATSRRVELESPLPAKLRRVVG
jgi:23S rRNA pseudouridine1911/1915/1917 synthase